jgi:hypothetical protein
MNTAIKASKKIKIPAAKGNTIGMRGTNASISSSWAGVGDELLSMVDMVST